MRNTLDIVLSMCGKYREDGLHILLLAVAIAYLCLTAKRQKERMLWVWVTLVFGVIFFCPITAKFIMKYCVGTSVYWRMIWLLPKVLIIAYVGATVLGQIRKRAIRPLLLIVMIFAIGVTGSCVYFHGNYKEADNLYKLPYPTVEICDLIAADAKDQQMDYVKVTVPNELVCYIRQYAPSFLMPYGRNGLKLEKLTQNQEGLFAQMNTKEPITEVLDMHLRTEGCNYFVWNRQDFVRQELEQFGFEPIGDIEGYRVYRIA